MQSDACAEFDMTKLFLHLSAEGGTFLCAHLKIGV